MKANCLRPRHSGRTATKATYSDPFLLAQWQSNSSHDSCLAAKAAASPPMCPGAVGDDRRARRWAGVTKRCASTVAITRASGSSCARDAINAWPVTERRTFGSAACYVDAGNKPADWHPDCMAAYALRKTWR